MGASAETSHGYIDARTDRLRGGAYEFPRVSVTGTENALMAAVLADGETVLRNAAGEPEVEDLARFLTTLGARIEGAGTSEIRVRGVDSLGGGRHEIIPDRIEAGTYLVAGAITGGRVVVEDCRPDQMTAVLDALRATGVGLEVSGGRIEAWSNGELRPIDVATSEYPGFPTDMQAQYMALMTRAHGMSVIEEHIFENRFQHVSELARMGADIELDGVRATVRGPTSLLGSEVMATDLRASASLVLAGLAAEGETILHRVYHLDRGYEALEEKVRSLGGHIERVR
jgi:UDP-N-acetylglucosamine 1-carboxyvinyltransferase